jgi:hypothetical protein
LKTVYEKDVAYSYGKGNVFRNGTPLLYQSGLTVAMKITRAAQDTGFVVRCLNVNVEGGFGTNVWRTSAVASILSSSRSEFTCSN